MISPIFIEQLLKLTEKVNTAWVILLQKCVRIWHFEEIIPEYFDSSFQDFLQSEIEYHVTNLSHVCRSFVFYVFFVGSQQCRWFGTISFHSTCFLRVLEWLTCCSTQRRWWAEYPVGDEKYRQIFSSWLLHLQLVGFQTIWICWSFEGNSTYTKWPNMVEFDN